VCRMGADNSCYPSGVAIETRSDEMLNVNDSSMAANAICHAAEMTRETIRMAVYEYARPSTVHKPRLFIDGDQWCALLGKNLQDGVAGFGDSPSAAMNAFDNAWCEKLPAKMSNIPGISQKDFETAVSEEQRIIDRENLEKLKEG
jgi:hypothetical protein